VKYIITTLPDPAKVILYLSSTPVTLNQELLPADLANLVVKPVAGFKDNFDFKYTVEEARGLRDLTPATVFGTYIANNIKVDKALTSGQTVINPVTEYEYTIKVSNEKTTSSTGKITMTDTLPLSLNYVSHTAPADWTCTTAPKELKCTTTKTMAGGEVNIFKLKVLSTTVIEKIVDNSVVIKPEYPQDNVTDDFDNEYTPGNNPPETYNCDIGKIQQGMTTILGDKVADCLRATDPDITTIAPKTVAPLALPDFISKYVIKSLPDPLKGKLVYNGIDVKINQEFTPGTENKIQFVPQTGFTGSFDFTYTAFDSFGLEDKTPATVIGQYYPNDVSVTKDVDPLGTVFQAGLNTSYKITVKNEQSTAIIGKGQIIDTLPAELDFVSFGTIDPDWKCTNVGNKITCDKQSDWTANQTATIKISVKVKSQVLTAPVVNTVELVTPFAETITVNNKDTETTPVNNPPTAYDCNLGTTPVNANVVIKTIKTDCLKGTDPDAGDSVVKVIITTLPSALQGKLTLDGTDVTLNQVITPAKANDLIFVPAKDYVGEYSFTYTVEDTKGLQDLTPATVKGVLAPDDIEIKKKAQAPVFELFKDMDYQFTITNNGGAEIKDGLIIKDILPIGMEYLEKQTFAVTDVSCTYDKPTRLVTCKILKPLASKASFKFNITVRLNSTYALQNVLNQVKLDCLKSEKDCKNNEAFDETPVAEYDIAVVKEHVGEFRAGDKGLYTLTVSNTTMYDLKSPVTLNDELPAGLSVESVTVPNTDWVCTNTATSIECNNPFGLLAKESVKLELRVNIDPNAEGEVSNTAIVKTPTKEKTYDNNKSTDKVVIIKPATPRTGGVQALTITALLSILTLLSICIKFRKRIR
jgi:uncharacterized repeat protein (TIGR01451 family)